MFRIKLLFFIKLLIAVNYSRSMNTIKSQRIVYPESMCLLIDNDGQYFIKSFEKSDIKYRNVSIEIKTVANKITRNIVTKFGSNLITQSNQKYKTLFYFELDKLKKVYNLLRDAVFDQIVIDSNKSSTFKFDYLSTNHSQVGIYFYNMILGTTVGWTVSDTSIISIGHTSKGVKIRFTDLRNITWSDFLPNSVFFYLRMRRDIHLSMKYIGSTIITLSKKCLDVCKLQEISYKNHRKSFATYLSYGSEWDHRVMGQPIISTDYHTYSLRRELLPQYSNNSIIYTTYIKDREDSYTDMNWFKDVFSSPWYYIELPGLSIKNLLAICNDRETLDCYKINLQQTYKNETLNSFIILQNNQDGKIYIFEKYKDKILILNEINIPQIRFINALVFNVLPDSDQMSNQINIVLKDCLKKRHIMQAFDPLGVALHQNAICIIEESGIYQIVCEVDELTQFVDINVAYKLNNTTGAPFKVLTSSLKGIFQAVNDTLVTNYYIFERSDIYDFIHVGLGYHNDYTGIFQDKIITMNFDLFKAGVTSVIKFSTIDIYTAQLEIKSVSLSIIIPKVRLTISNGTIEIETFQVGVDADYFHDKILYRISYKTDDVKAELMSYNYSYSLIARTICH